MVDETTPASTSSNAARWVGYVLTFLPAAFLLFGSMMGLIGTTQAQDGLVQMGYPASSGRPIAVALLISTILYVVPQTAVLGAILLTGYFGGAVATHVRMQDGMFFIAVIFGVVIWLGLFLRDPRLRALIPLRKL